MAKPQVQETPVVETPPVAEVPAVVETPVVAEAPAVVEDDFSKAFEELAAELTPPADKKTAPVVEAPAVVEAPVVEAPAVVETPAVAEVPAGGETAEQKSERLQAELDALRAAPPAAAAPVAEVPAVETPMYTADEQATLDTYLKDWPDVAAAEELRRRAEYREVVKHIFGAIQARYDHLIPFAEEQSAETQYTKIVGLVPDYVLVRDATIAWAGKQPAYLKTAYENVISSGSPKDVADLITRFKKETGYQPPAVPAGVIPAVPAVTTGMPAPAPEVARAVASLQLVDTSRTEQHQGDDPNDFDGAFKEFAKPLK